MKNSTYIVNSSQHLAVNGNVISSVPVAATFPLTKIIVAITVSVVVVATLAISISVPLSSKKSNDPKTFYPEINSDNTTEEGEFIEEIKNYSYATLTPRTGYDNILIFLGDISNNSTYYFSFFENNETTFVPEKTKIICLSGNMRKVQYMIDYYNNENDVPAWFNVDKNGTLIYEGDDPYIEAKESKELILNQIDESVKEVNNDYSKVFLGGFGQGAVMTNYVMLNSKNELGGYLPFNGYIFDDHFSSTFTVIKNLNNEQLNILNDKKDYYICASNSYSDEILPISVVITQYDSYFINYTNTLHFSFGIVGHVLEIQPTLPMVKLWLKERMGIIESIYDY